MPSLHLKVNTKENSSQELLQMFQKEKNLCAKRDCREIYLAAQSISSQNLCLLSQIKTLEKKVIQLEEEIKNGPFVQGDCMLGPTQLRCLAKKSTKGRHWTNEEKFKAKTLKKMTSHRCYNYIRKNIVPLPCPSELGDKEDMKEEEVKTMEDEGQVCETYVINSIAHASGIKSEEELDDADQVVHHIVVPPEVWTAQGEQKFEFVVS